jgi:hypothetical protein
VLRLVVALAPSSRVTVVARARRPRALRAIRPRADARSRTAIVRRAPPGTA